MSWKTYNPIRMTHNYLIFFLFLHCSSIIFEGFKVLYTGLVSKPLRLLFAQYRANLYSTLSVLDPYQRKFFEMTLILFKQIQVSESIHVYTIYTICFLTSLKHHI